MEKFEILYKMQTFKLENGKFKSYTLVVVRLRDNTVVTVLLPLPEHLVSVKDVEAELRKMKLL